MWDFVGAVAFVAVDRRRIEITERNAEARNGCDIRTSVRVSPCCQRAIAFDGDKCSIIADDGYHIAQGAGRSRRRRRVWRVCVRRSERRAVAVVGRALAAQQLRDSTSVLVGGQPALRRCGQAAQQFCCLAAPPVLVAMWQPVVRQLGNSAAWQLGSPAARHHGVLAKWRSPPME